jgi:hypothetical protein
MVPRDKGKVWIVKERDQIHPTRFLTDHANGINPLHTTTIIQDRQRRNAHQIGIP